MTLWSVDGNQKPQAPGEIGMWLLPVLRNAGRISAPLEAVAVAPLAVVQHAEQWKPQCPSACIPVPSAPWAFFVFKFTASLHPTLQSFDCVPLAKLARPGICFPSYCGFKTDSRMISLEGTPMCLSYLVLIAAEEVGHLVTHS